jgi:translation elongation factor P/translation initiation factor 5A
MSEEQATQTQEVKNDTIESNLSKQRKMYERQLEQERGARQQAEERAATAERLAQERSRRADPHDDDDQEDDEPYVDRRKLNKELHKFQKNIEQTIDQKAEAKAMALLEQERRSNYLKENNDFDQIMNPDTIEKFAQKHPRLAENILRMPEGFERNKLVYENIKALRIDQPEKQESSIQEKIDLNKRSPYYQPSSVGATPNAMAGDFSDSCQKNAYAKMQDLKKRMRL